MARFLVSLARTCHLFPKVTLILCFLAFAVSVVFGASGLQLKMDWTYLFEADDPVVRKIQDAREIFPFPGDIAVLVDRGTPAQRERFMDALGEKLQNEPEVFYHVFYRFDLQALSSQALYYLDEETLADLDRGLEEVQREGDTVTAPDGTGLKVMLKLLADLHESLSSRGRTPYVPIWEFLAEDQDTAIDTAVYLGALMRGERYIYVTMGGGRLHALVLKSGGRGEILAPQHEAVTRLRAILKEMSPTTGDLRIRLTGLPVMLNDERETVTRDGIRSGLISMVLILCVFTVGFGEWTRPTLAVTALTCGLGWTLAYTTVTVGHLNFITVSLATMLMGLGIDFGIHILFRFDEELFNGRTPLQAIEETMAGTGVDTFVGAAATSTAFLALTQADFRGIADLGVIAAGGVMLIYFSTVMVLPALLALFPQEPIDRSSSPVLGWLETQILNRAISVSILGIAVLVLAGLWATQVKFSYNLLEVQAPEISSVRTELEMIQELKTTVLSAELVVRGEPEARRLVKAFESLSSVARVGSVLGMIPEVTPEKQALVEEVVKKVRGLEMPDRVALESAEDLLDLQRRMEDLEGSYTGGTHPDLEEAIAIVKDDVGRMDPGPIQDGLSVFQTHVRDDLARTLEFLKVQRAEPPDFEDIPEDLRIRFVSPDGYFKLNIEPVRNIWEKENLEEFLSETQQVDPELIGHPVVQKHILEAFNRAFERTPWYTLIGVLVVMLVYLRSPRAVFLSLLPTASGVIIIFAIMGYTGMAFNVVNFVALPMSVGIGAVYGVHALHRMRELKDETLLTSSTGPALLLSGLTTMVGFATLMGAAHRGLASLGFVISVGVAVNFLFSLLYLPAIRRALKRAVSRWRRLV